MPSASASKSHGSAFQQVEDEDGESATTPEDIDTDAIANHLQSINETSTELEKAQSGPIGAEDEDLMSPWKLQPQGAVALNNGVHEGLMGHGNAHIGLQNPYYRHQLPVQPPLRGNPFGWPNLMPVSQNFRMCRA